MREDIEGELYEQLKGMGPAEKRRMLQFARALKRSAVPGTAGRDITRFAGTIPAEDLDAIAAEIDSGCEQVNPNEW
jgi:hypothetical protein